MSESSSISGLSLILDSKSVVPVCDAHYNPIKDLKRVNQLGVFDLAAAYATGAVPANVSVSDSHFNGIDDPRSIDGRPADVFEALAADKAIRDYKPDSSGDQ